MKNIIVVLMFTILWANFGPNVNISENAGTHNKMPDIAIDENGVIHVVWVNTDNNKNIFYANSHDYGITFSTLH